MRSLTHCFPETLREVKFVLSKIQSQFGDQLVIVDHEFKNDEASEVISYIAENLSDQDINYLTKNFERKTDMENRELHFRINKFLPLKDQIMLSDGSDVIKVKIKYQVFTSQQNTWENIRNCFSKVGLIQA
jgi:RNA binding exosome subunit